MSARPVESLADDGARRLARERFDVPVLLEAGAGTGKTRALIERLLVWSLDAGWDEGALRLAERARAAGRSAPDPSSIAAEVLDGVVAITFTEAAAAEMASRLGSALGRLARGATPDEAADLAGRLGPRRIAERAAALADALGRARIQTIHAFCRALLAAHPFDAGLHPAFEIDADQEALERVATEVLSARTSAALTAGDADWMEIAADGLEPEMMLEALVAAVSKGVTGEDLEADPFPAERIAGRLRDARAGLAPLVDALATVVERLPRTAKAREVEPALREVLEELAGDATAEMVAHAGAASDALLADHGKTLADWAKGKSTATVVKHLPTELGDFRALAADARRSLGRLAGLDPRALARARRVFAPLVREVRERLRREGQVLFDDLLDRAARLLETRADVRATVRRGIRQLLVDEFQDTDRRQCALVARLALDGDPARRPGLFVVGDPKQSIYGWRSADLAAYEEFLAAARAAGAVEGRLAVNFRSVPAILDEVERVLAPALRPEPGLQPAFERLEASDAGRARAERRKGLPAVEYWISVSPRTGTKTASGAASRIEARAIAADLLAQRRTDPTLNWSECALLARSGGDLELYLQALREAAIPFAVERDRSYWRRREVIDAAALVRAAIDPGDHLALVTLLRSPFVGVPDAALLPLWRARFPERIDRLSAPDSERLAELRALLRRVAAELPAEIPHLDRVAGWETSAFAALEALAELRAAFGREPAERFVERLRARFALEASAAARFLGRFGLANLERFLRELEAELEASGDDPAAVVRFLRRAVAERRAAEEARPPETDVDAVPVMTIHRAKGLEFRHVYLLQAHKGRRTKREEPPFDAERSPGGELAYRLFERPNLAWADALERREAVAERELVRLLYVAMTRAKERLVIAGQQLASRASEGSFLPLLRERFEASRAAALVRDAAAGLPLLDEQGVLWRAPALETGWSDEPAPRPQGATVPIEDAAVLARDLDRLTARRIAAAARAGRPRFQRASDLVAFESDPVDDVVAETSPVEPGRTPAWARARGVALHRAFELAPLAASDAGAWRAAARSALLAELPSAGATELSELDGALDRLVASGLWTRLSQIEHDVRARELPVLVAAGAHAETGPIDGTLGTLDLVYRDPESGEIVVADFKTDEVASDEEAAVKVALYRPQLALYGRAVGHAFALPTPPRLELWLIALDRIVPLGSDDARDESG